MNVRNSLLILLLFALLAPTKLLAQFFYESSIGKPLQAGQLRAPSDVSIDGSGNIFVVDAAGQIVKFNVGGTHLLSFGTRGQGNGQFSYPNCIALDQSGNIYVADTHNSTVLKFNSSGVFQSNLTTPEIGQIMDPHGLDIDSNGNIFVSSNGRQKILKFNSLGTFIKEFGSQGTGNGQFSFANAVATDASGNVYVLDTSFPRVQKFNNNGDYLAQWGSTGGGDGQFGWPLGMTTDASGNVYVSEYYSHRIQKFNINGGFSSKFGSFGSNSNEFYFPKGMAIDAAGNIYVADESNSRVQKFNSSFSYQSTLGIPLGNEQLYNPHGVTTDPTGNIYVADTSNDQIQKFSSTGTFITRWGGFGSTNGKFNSPYDMAIDAVGNVYVVDGGCSVQKFSSSGTFIQKWAGTYGPGDNQLADPRGIAIDASNNVYVVDKNNHRIVKYSNSGTFITKWGQLGIGTGDFNNPNGIAIDASGNIYVCDTENDRILKFTNTGVPLGQWGTTSTGNALFDNPVAICISPSGKIFITDSNRIQIFDSDGKFQGNYNAYSFGGSGFLGPVGIETNSAGALYLADRSNHRINKYLVLDLLSLSANNGVVGTSMTISGTGFSTVASENIVKFNGITATVTSAGATTLSVTVPAGATTGKVSVTRQGFTVTSVNEFLVLPLAITSFTPGIASQGASITITGTGFSSVKENNTVKFNGIASTITASTATSITATVPGGNTIGKISVSVNGITATSTNNFEGTLAINSFTPASGLIGSSVTLSGTGFSSTAANQVVKFNGTTATVTSSSLNSLTVTVPAGATTGKISIERDGSTVLSTNEFLVLPLAVTSFTPQAGIVGTPVTISGTGFSSVNSNNSVTINGVTTIITASTPTSIATTVPVGATKGKISITVGGQTATSTSDFTITKLGISQTIYPEFFVIGENGATVSISVNDITEVQSIKINRRGITEDDSKLKADVIPFTTSGNTISLSVPASYFTDPLGLYCWFTLTEKSGNEISGPSRNIYLKYPASSDNQVIPDLKSGRSGSDYQLFAVPLDLTKKNTRDVFAALGSYDNKKWRLFSLSNEKLTENPPAIETGIGYWFIMRDQNEINPGQGNVVKVTKQNPYTLSLSQGWNLIGNPYNFNISWEDVLAHNGLSEDELKFRQFLDGSFVNEVQLKRYRGGFVDSDVARSIEIPIINRSLGGGRKNTKKLTAIDELNWQVNFTVEEGEYSNSLYGFGMKPTAREGKDLADETALPQPEGLCSFDLVFAHPDNVRLIKEIVPAQTNYTWVANLTTTNDLILKWDNSYFGTNEKQLMLEISDRVELIDMRKSILVTIPPGNHNLKFHFGTDEYIGKQVLEETIRVGHVFPNPINRDLGLLQLPISLPEGLNEIEVSLQSIHGSKLDYLSAGVFDGGRQLLTWRPEIKDLKPGLYILKIESYNSRTGGRTHFIKVILE